ncbi:HERC1 [Symbiodinium sp. KB8]|nr:HERC1 [Symbiodinium sp. KB8]
MDVNAQINPHVQNKRGATPLDLCSDVSTREALRTFALKTPEVTSRINSVEEFQRLARVQGEVGEDPTATCEPFFVPRQPVFEDEAHYKVLVNIGLEMLGASSPALRIRGEWTRLFTFGCGTLGELGYVKASAISEPQGLRHRIAPMIFLADQRTDECFAACHRSTVEVGIAVHIDEAGSRQPIVLFKDRGRKHPRVKSTRPRELSIRFPQPWSVLPRRKRHYAPWRLLLVAPTRTSSATSGRCSCMVSCDPWAVTPARCGCPRRSLELQVLRIAAGWRHVLLLTKAGSVFAIGEDDYGQCSGCGTGQVAIAEASRGATEFPHVCTGAIGVAAGACHSVAWGKGGAFSWGHGGAGRLGLGSTDHQRLPVQIQAFNGLSVLHASCGANFTVFVTAPSRVAVAGSGVRVWSCGGNQYGQLGIGEMEASSQILTPRIVDFALLGGSASRTRGTHGIEAVEGLECGAHHVICLTRPPGHDRRVVWAWGSAARGQCGRTFGERAEDIVPRRWFPQSLADFSPPSVHWPVGIAAGRSHSAVLARALGPLSHGSEGKDAPLPDAPAWGSVGSSARPKELHVKKDMPPAVADFRASLAVASDSQNAWARRAPRRPAQESHVIDVFCQRLASQPPGRSQSLPGRSRSAVQSLIHMGEEVLKDSERPGAEAKASAPLLATRRDSAVRPHDGELVGAFGYRKLQRAEWASVTVDAWFAKRVGFDCLCVASGKDAGAVALCRWDTDVGKAACQDATCRLLCCLSIIWLGGSFWATLLLLGVLWKMTVAKPELRKPSSILPSSLSRIVRLEELALHLLQSECEKEADVSKAAMLCCHGFGANGTSYEEVLPLFLKSGLASVVLCPDQVGFGLTERPNLVFRRGMSFRTGDQTTLGNLSAPQMYTLPGNAILAGALLDRECELHRNSLIIGHSMGAITASAVAVARADRDPGSVTLVLESPAFLVKPSSDSTTRRLGRVAVLGLRLLRLFLRFVLQLPGLTYNRLFWRSGLASAYADMGAERLDKQVLLYRWPSLCEGWALGLANFLSARLLSISEDGLVLQRLVDAPGHNGGGLRT